MRPRVNWLVLLAKSEAEAQKGNMLVAKQTLQEAIDSAPTIKLRLILENKFTSERVLDFLQEIKMSSDRSSIADKGEYCRDIKQPLP